MSHPVPPGSFHPDLAESVHVWIVDRIETDRAILISPEGEVVGGVPRALLPSGLQEGDWIEVHPRADGVQMRLAQEQSQAQTTRASVLRSALKVSASSEAPPGDGDIDL